MACCVAELLEEDDDCFWLEDIPRETSLFLDDVDRLLLDEELYDEEALFADDRLRLLDELELPELAAAAAAAMTDKCAAAEFELFDCDDNEDLW